MSAPPPAPFRRVEEGSRRCEYDLHGRRVVVEFEGGDRESARRVAFEANRPEGWDERAILETMRASGHYVLIAHTPPQGVQPPPEDEIRYLAYAYHEQHKRLFGPTAHGHDKKDWRRADEELRTGRTIAALVFEMRDVGYVISDIAVHPNAPYREHCPALLADALKTIAGIDERVVTLHFRVSLDPNSQYIAAKKLIGLE